MRVRRHLPSVFRWMKADLRRRRTGRSAACARSLHPNRSTGWRRSSTSTSIWRRENEWGQRRSSTLQKLRWRQFPHPSTSSAPIVWHVITFSEEFASAWWAPMVLNVFWCIIFSQVRTWFQNRRMKLKRDLQDYFSPQATPLMFQLPAVHYHQDMSQFRPNCPAPTMPFYALPVPQMVFQERLPSQLIMRDPHFAWAFGVNVGLIDWNTSVPLWVFVKKKSNKNQIQNRDI